MKLTQKTVWLALCAFVTFTMQTGVAQAEGEVEAAIKAQNAAWAAAYNAGDAAAVAALYEADAILMPPGVANVVGPVDIEAAVARMFGASKGFRLVTEKVIEAGDYAIEVGHAHLTAIAADGSESSARAKYVVAWHKGDDGAWRFAVDMFGPDAAPQAE